MSTVDVYYDGECPFCSRYVRMLRLKEAVGHLRLIDLRENSEMRSELSRQGFDLDQGMVVEIGGRRYGGGEATNQLALMSTPINWFNKLNRMIFSNPRMAALSYPVLRTGRWITLFALGRQGLNEAYNDVAARQVLFSSLFALISLFHVFNYAFAYGRFPPQADLIAVFAAAVLVLARPQSARALAVLMLASLISAIAQAPVQSNHTILRNIVVVGYWLSFAVTAIRARPATEVFANFTLAGCGALLVMYVFGIFHKINTDFLNPETSCALALWAEMPWPLHAIQGTAMDMLAIYGTFAVEGAIMLALIFPRTRYVGLVCGIAFHVLLGLSNYAAYLAFTTLTISLHVLFLSPSQLDRINRSPEMALIRRNAARPIYVGVFLVLLAGGALAMSRYNFTVANIYLLPMVLPLCYLILRYGAHVRNDSVDRRGRTAFAIGAFATSLYFLSAIMPYMGLKTAQSINMFANLRLEQGVSNHLVFSNPPGPFTYLEDVAVITGSENSTLLTG